MLSESEKRTHTHAHTHTQHDEGDLKGKEIKLEDFHRVRLCVCVKTLPQTSLSTGSDSRTSHNCQPCLRLSIHF